MTEEDEAFKDLEERIKYRDVFPKKDYNLPVDRN